MSPTLLKVLQNRYIQLGIAGVLGVFLGTTIMASKTTTTQTEKQLQTELQTEKDAHEKDVSSLKQQTDETLKEEQTKEMTMKVTLDTLNAQIEDLKKNSKSTHFKIVKPDGTVVERDTAQSSEEDQKTIITQVKQEYDQKLKSVEQKYVQIHEQRVQEIQKQFDSKETEYKKEIEDLKSKKEVVSNPKSFGISAGVDRSLTDPLHSDTGYYVGGSYTVSPPFFIESSVSHSSSDNRISFGAGMNL